MSDKIINNNGFLRILSSIILISIALFGIFMNDKFIDVMNNIKESYDKIVIDTAPLGLVADAYMIMKHTDINLYVVRQGFRFFCFHNLFL